MAANAETCSWWRGEAQAAAQASARQACTKASEPDGLTFKTWKSQAGPLFQSSSIRSSMVFAKGNVRDAKTLPYRTAQFFAKISKVLQSDHIHWESRAKLQNVLYLHAAWPDANIQRYHALKLGDQQGRSALDPQTPHTL